MNTQKRAAMSLSEYATLLAATMTATHTLSSRRETAMVRVVSGETRIYRGEDYVEVFKATDGTGGTSGIVGRDRGFSAALSEAERKLGDVPIAPAPAPTPAKPATPAAFGSQFGECAECNGPTRNGAHILRHDSSGLSGWCCARCAAGGPETRSFA